MPKQREISPWGDLEPFVFLFREQGEAETRTITIMNHATIPDGQYALADSYCTDPTCDCQRVMLNVVNRQQMSQGVLATISYGFDRDDEMAGPFLDSLNPQSEYAQALMDIVSRMLETDAAYVDRLKAHYRQVKDALADPSHAIHRTLTRLDKKIKRPSRQRSRPRKYRRR